MNLNAQAIVGIKSRYKFIAVNVHTGKERELSGWSNNILLTSGRNELAKQNWFTSCQVGTSAVAPSSNQTALLGYIAGSNNILEETSGAQSTPPYYGWKRRRFRFSNSSGIANQNLNEVGIGWSTASGDTLATRALIEDINGVQVTITPLPDEFLDVVCEIRYYPPLTDVTGIVIFNGVTYDYIVRAAEVVSSSAWGVDIGQKISSLALFTGDWSVFDDNIGTITTGPSGVAIASDNTNDYTAAYSENSYEITVGMIVGPTGWNSLTNKLLRSLRFKTTAGWYQVQFDSQSNPGFGIPKTDEYTMQVQFILGWDEQVIP